MIRLPYANGADRQASSAEAAAHLAAGGLLAYPTETVYGFGCALAAAPLARLAALKRRTSARPFLVLAADPAQLPMLAWTESARRLAAAFWPGPLTLVLGTSARLPDQVTAQDGTVAIRISPHPGVQALLAAHGAPITSTSANAPGQRAATSGEFAVAAATGLAPAESWLVLDAGTLPASPSSTIVRCVDEITAIVRPGAIPLARLREVIEEIHGGT